MQVIVLPPKWDFYVVFDIFLTAFQYRFCWPINVWNVGEWLVVKAIAFVAVSTPAQTTPWWVKSNRSYHKVAKKDVENYSNLCWVVNSMLRIFSGMINTLIILGQTFWLKTKFSQKDYKNIWKTLRRISMLVSYYVPSWPANESLCLGSAFSVSLEITSSGFPLLFFLFFGDTVTGVWEAENKQIIFVTEHLKDLKLRSDIFKIKSYNNTVYLHVKEVVPWKAFKRQLLCFRGIWCTESDRPNNGCEGDHWKPWRHLTRVWHDLCGKLSLHVKVSMETRRNKMPSDKVSDSYKKRETAKEMHFSNEWVKYYKSFCVAKLDACIQMSRQP